MFNIKELFIGIALVFLLGVGGFLYRSALKPSFPGSLGSGVCVSQVKECPNGTLVGRVGQECTFAKCPPPNISLPSVGIAFALPSGFASSTSFSRDSARVAFYSAHTGLTASSTVTITIYRYAIPAGKTAYDVISTETTRATKDVPSAYVRGIATTTIGTNTFTSIIVTRMNRRVSISYYLPRTYDVLRFDVVEHSPARWADRAFTVKNLSGNQTLRTLLATLQIAP